MAAKSTFPAYNMACDGQLAKLILNYRDVDELSWQRIAVRLFADHRVDIDPNTLKLWYGQILEGRWK